MTRALLIALIDVPAELTGDFNRWYDTEHVPERAAVPGLGPITRWHQRSGDLPRFLALFDADSAEVLSSGPYAALKASGDSAWTQSLRSRFQRVIRGTFDQVADYGGAPGTAGSCVVALTQVDGDDEPAYRRWYDEEHGPAVAGVPGVVRVRRFERDGDGPRHLTVLDLTAADVLGGQAYAEAKDRFPAGALRTRWQRSQGIYDVFATYRDATYRRAEEA